MKSSLKIIAIISMAVSLVGCGAYTLTQQESNSTNLGAMQYAQADGGKVISCSGQDSDGDHYVTCTIKGQDGTDKAILCAYGPTPGCKPKG